ncbi:MAG: hypothetical protein FWC83_01140 [Alphaproteobacteria bacterium]|nr:hypothetical protein [Alphaproteobacteria bacterium]
MKQAYFVYPGLGKTTLAKKNAKIADIESKVFKDKNLAEYIGRQGVPNYRGEQVVNINPEWPSNLYQFMQSKLENGKILVAVPKQDGYDAFDNLNIVDYAFVLPTKERLNQLRKDYINRGDAKEYINNNLTVRYNEVLNYAKSTGKEIIFVEPGQYLEDVIKD